MRRVQHSDVSDVDVRHERSFAVPRVMQALQVLLY